MTQHLFSNLIGSKIQYSETVRRYVVEKSGLELVWLYIKIQCGLMTQAFIFEFNR